MSDSPEEHKSPLREIVQPFIDLAHAPRALWGINLAYVIEGMVYFGMLGYLAIHFSDFIFQSVEHADEWSHNMVMVLTAGITIAMFFLGVVADKKGVRFALVAAFICMLIGRSFMSGAPNVMGLDPVRPGVVVGDQVSLHVTRLETRGGVKAITKATVIANDQGGAQAEVATDLAEGEGIVPSETLESKLVRLGKAELLKGESPEWKVQYGSSPVTAQLLMHTSEELGLHAGSTVSLRRAYVFKREKKKDDKEDKKSADDETEEASAKEGAEGNAAINEKGDKEQNAEEHGEKKEYEFVIRTHWLEDVVALDTFPQDLSVGDGIEPDESLESQLVQLSEARLVKGEGKEWQVQYGGGPVTARLVMDTRKAPPLCAGATISLNRATVSKRDKAGDEAEFVIRTRWPQDVAAIDISGCTEPDQKTAAITQELTPDLALGEGMAPDAALDYETVQLGRAELIAGKPVEGKDWEWQVQYGSTPVTARLLIRSTEEPPLRPGALISLSRAEVIKPDREGAEFVIRARWPEDVAAVNTYGCQESPYPSAVTAREQMLRSDSRWPVTEESTVAADAPTVSLADLRQMEDGPVDVILREADVSYVRNGGYVLQSHDAQSAISAVVAPFWSPLHIGTLLGMLLVVIGYGMYQPAAYAGVRQFTTPKTAAMGFAMLYALMNLGGWLPTFAFLVRDDDFLGLGIPGTYWVYTGFTLIALLVTIIILTPKTVRNAVETATLETEAIKAAEAKESKKGEQKEQANQSPATNNNATERVKPHMWLFWLGAMVLFLFKGESPWYYSWEEARWRWILAGVIFISPLGFAIYTPARRWVAKHPLSNSKFAFFIFALIPVQTLFTYNWFILPQYISRAFEGWIGDYFEIMANANPLLIFIAVPIITAITQKAKVYNMMIIGTFVMAAPAFLLTVGPKPWALIGYLLIMTIGEAMWQPRFLQYAAEIAPKGRTGEYMGVAQFPWFLTKVLVPLLYSGRMVDRFCPKEGPKNTEFMWFVFGCIAICSTILLIIAKPWVGKGFKTKAEE